MPLFAFYCRDGDGAAALREQHLAAHLDHVEAHIADYAIAGPLKDGEETIGSMLVIKADTQADAQRKFEADPYFSAGIWFSISASEFRGVAGDWVGGAAWKN